MQVDEFKDLFDDEFYDWLAQYLVLKRASIEANYHSLYMSFMDSLSSSRLSKVVLRETYRNIKVNSVVMFAYVWLIVVNVTGDIAVW